MNKKLKGIMAGLALVVVTGASPALAGTNTADLNVSATVTSTCSISAAPLAFGAYDPVAGTLVDGSANLSVSCTQGATATVTLGQGAHAGGASTDAAPVRRLANGSSMLSYTLYTDTGRTTAWGNTAGTGVGFTSTSSAPRSITVYGRIGASQDVPAGTYTDTVVATVTF